MLLSVVIPAYNERHTLGTILRVVARAMPNVSKEVIVVDDCSKDGTREWLKDNFPQGARIGSSVDLNAEGNLIFVPESGASTVTVRPIFHERNRGKGGALQTGLAAQRLHDEVGHHATVVGMHPRPIGVEDSRHLDANTVLPVIIEE